MKNSKSLVLLLYLLLLIKTNNTQHQSLFIQATKCLISYDWLQGNFLFNNCSTPTQSNGNWTACLSKCCPDVSTTNSTPSYQTLRMCQDENVPENSSTVANITAGVVVGLLVVVLLICYGSCCCKDRCISKDETIQSPQWHDQPQVNHQFRKIKWSSLSSQQNKLDETDSRCSICLEGALTTAQLICRHRFHPKCIGSWLKKGDCCPNCRQENIRCLRIYCRECKWRYFVSGRQLTRDKFKQLPQIYKECKKSKKDQRLKEEVDIMQMSSSLLFQKSKRKDSANIKSACDIIMVQSVELS